jgi:hypothetical protein
VLELDGAQQRALLGRSTEEPSVALVAINVEPHVAGPVGVKVWRGGRKGESIDGAYSFPRRGAEGTRFLRPEELALIMDGQYRRTLLQLEQIGAGSWVQFWVPQYTQIRLMTQTTGEIVRVDHGSGTVLLKNTVAEAVRCEVPVALVRAVWRSGDGNWNVALSGSMLQTDHVRWTSRFNPVL